MNAKRTTTLLLAVLAFYQVLLSRRAAALLHDDRLAFRGLGVGVLLVGVVGTVLVVAEVRFGFASQRLARAAGDVAVPEFEAAKSAVEAAPDDWRAWYALALAYDAGRDPRRGRAAMRRAIALERGAR